MRNDFRTDYLEHSAKGTTWTKKDHKWVARKWLNGRWVYYYKISGKGYLDAARKTQNKADVRKDMWNREVRATREDSKYPTRFRNELYKEKRQYDAASRKNMNDYYTKSLAGRVEKAVEKGQATINRLLRSLKSTTTETVTDTFTGKTRTPNHTGDDVVNIKELSEKNKKKKK